MRPKMTELRLLVVIVVLHRSCLGFPLTNDHTIPEQNSHLPNTARVIDGKNVSGLLTGNNEFLVQGDIIKADVPITMTARTSVRNRQLTWTDSTVPYKFRDGDYDEEEKKIIRGAISEFQSLISGCVKFYEVSAPVKDYLVIQKGSGCYSSVGRIGGEQNVSLATRCLGRKGTIYHEMMHALGFWHEHNRPDRDNHITILLQNIQELHKMDFAKENALEVDTLNQPYDLESVMHYSQYTFTKYPDDPTKRTFTVINENVNESLIGQRTHLSQIDINKIKSLYNCHSAITQCQYPGNIANGKVQGLNTGASAPVGTWISYTCNAGYTLVGPDRRGCKNNASWTGFQPECLQPNKDLINYCSFQNNDTCGWRQDKTDDFDWRLLNKTTDTKQTGPTVDNTYEGKGGAFIYMESSSPQHKGQKTRLISPDIIPNSTKHHIKFFYHMFGGTMGTLNVYMKLAQPGAKEVLLKEGTKSASLTGNHGNTWHMMEFKYDVLKHQTYNIIFEGIVGYSFHSDIGVDDIIIKEIPEIQVTGAYTIFNNPFKVKIPSSFVHHFNPFIRGVH